MLFPPTLGNVSSDWHLQVFPLHPKFLTVSYVPSIQLEIGCTDVFILNMESICGWKLYIKTT